MQQLVIDLGARREKCPWPDLTTSSKPSPVCLCITIGWPLPLGMELGASRRSSIAWIQAIELRRLAPSSPPFGYGTRGKPAKFYCLDPFETELDECFQELWDLC